MRKFYERVMAQFAWIWLIDLGGMEVQVNRITGEHRHRPISDFEGQAEAPPWIAGYPPRMDVARTAEQMAKKLCARVDADTPTLPIEMRDKTPPAGPLNPPPAAHAVLSLLPNGGYVVSEKPVTLLAPERHLYAGTRDECLQFLDGWMEGAEVERLVGGRDRLGRGDRT